MFIEFSRTVDSSKFKIRIQSITYFEPALKYIDGKEPVEVGTFIHIIGGDVITVNESYEAITQKIDMNDPSNVIIGTMKEAIKCVKEI